MAVTSIELSISRAGDGHAASLVAELPNSRAQLATDIPLTIHHEALRALELAPEVYGATLAAMAFPAPLREAWSRARGQAEGRAAALRLRLTLDEADDALHALLWETLRDPLTSLPLARGEAARLARYLPSASLTDVEPPPRPDLRAVVAVAAPSGALPVDVPGIAGAALAGLADIPSTTLDGREGRPPATLANLTAALRGGAPILFLACHGALVEGEPYLWLEQARPGPYRPVAGSAFVEALTQLAARPLLVVLAACQGAGTSYQVLRAIGPQLARAGIGAVLAMREQIPQATVAALLPPLFAELRRDGEIDRALAAARAALGEEHPWWLPVLWLRSRDGRLWREEPQQAPAPPPVGGIHIGGSVGTMQVINVSGGSVGSIIGSQTNYGAPAGTRATDVLRALLAQHREALARHLGQLATSGSANVRPETSPGIHKARGEIRRLKAQLHALGEPAEDLPGDEEVP